MNSLAPCLHAALCLTAAHCRQNDADLRIYLVRLFHFTGTSHLIAKTPDISPYHHLRHLQPLTDLILPQRDLATSGEAIRAAWMCRKCLSPLPPLPLLPTCPPRRLRSGRLLPPRISSHSHKILPPSCLYLSRVELHFYTMCIAVR